jgi:hypothetical protein
LQECDIAKVKACYLLGQDLTLYDFH